MTGPTMENPAGLQPDELLEKIERNEVPRDFLGLVARGFLPIPQDDLIAILAVLAGYEDSEIAASARQSLDEIPRTGLLTFALNGSSNPSGLNALLSHTEDQEVLGALIRNPSTSNEAVARFAPSAAAKIQEVIVTNQKRLIEAPAILEGLLANPDLTADVKRRIQEVREEFFDKRASREAMKAALAAEAAAEGEVLSEEEAETLTDLITEAEVSEEDPAGKVLPEDVPEEEKSVWIRIVQMAISDRVKLAFRGGRTERAILIKDRNKLVSTAVIKSPRLTETEVEAFASMRNLETEVLRQIGMKREWMRKYPIMLTYVRNPKAPIGVVLPLINRLNLRDLKNLSQDRNIPETVRVSARKLFLNRSKH